MKRLFAGLLLAASVFAGNWPTDLTGITESGRLAGVVSVVVDKEKVLEEHVAGYSDAEKKIPLKRDALFWIASETKSFTAVSLMMLVDEGKVSLDDTVAKYYPEFQPGKHITLRMVMSHTAGFPFLLPDEKRIDALSHEQKMKIYSTLPLIYEPGTQYKYSNIGINIAGAVVEKVSGEKIEDFMKRRIFEPLEMKDTSFFPTAEAAARLVRNHVPNADKTKLTAGDVPYMTPLSSKESVRYAEAGGGLFSTADDMVHYVQMFLNGGVYKGHRILSEEAVRQISAKQTGDRVTNNYGLGIQVENGGFGHGGACGTQFFIGTRDGIGLVYMVQHSGYLDNGSRCWGEFRQWALEKYGKK